MTVPINRSRERGKAPEDSQATPQGESHSRATLRRFLDEAEPKVKAIKPLVAVLTNMDISADEKLEALRKLAEAPWEEWLTRQAIGPWVDRPVAPLAFDIMDELERQVEEIRSIAVSHMKIAELRARTRANRAPSAKQQELSVRLARLVAVLGEIMPPSLMGFDSQDR
jgi:hypothetical protein